MSCRVISPEGETDHSWICVSSQKELTTSHGQDTTRTWRWSLSTLHRRNQDSLHWKAKRSGYRLTALLLPMANTAPCGEDSPELMVSPVGKMRTFQWPLPVLCVTSWEPILLFNPWGLLGSLWLQPWKIYDREGGGVSNNQSAEPSWWYIVTREQSGVQVCLI